MNISLTDELEELVEDKVKSGLYQTASEVIREALRLLLQRDEVRKLRLEALRKEVAIGIEQADRGKLAPLEMDEILAESRARLNKKKNNR